MRSSEKWQELQRWVGALRGNAEVINVECLIAPEADQSREEDCPG